VLKKKLLLFLGKHTSRLLPWESESDDMPGERNAETEAGAEAKTEAEAEAGAGAGTYPPSTPAPPESKKSKRSAHISIPICAYPDTCKRGCRDHESSSTADSVGGAAAAVVLTEEESIACLEDRMKDMQRQGKCYVDRPCVRHVSSGCDVHCIYRIVMHATN
jgi:hypothetical protein